MIALGLTLAFVGALVGCEAVRRYALRHALLDAPDERKLHKTPTPRLGGAGIFAGTALGCLALFWGTDPPRRTWALLGLALPYAALGLVDDVKPMRMSLRFGLQIAVASALVYLVGVPTAIPLAAGVVVSLPAWVVAPAAVVWIVGVVNITNFMDGMDGLAGTQTAAAALALGAALAGAGHVDLAVVALCLAAASGGFLVHNSPPARIFMGDAGSMFIGFLLGALPFVAVRAEPALPLGVGPMALAPFLLDATFTRAKRAARGGRFWEPHKEHLYQRAVSSGLEHRDVLVAYAAWIAVSAGAAVVAARADGRTTLACAAVCLTGFSLVLGWVRGREARGGSEAG